MRNERLETPATSGGFRYREVAEPVGFGQKGNIALEKKQPCNIVSSIARKYEVSSILVVFQKGAVADVDKVAADTTCKSLT